MDQNKLKEGVLCSIKMSRWGAYAKVKPDFFGKDAPKEILRGSQDLLLDKTYLKQLISIHSRAKYIIMKDTLPFPIENVFFIPKEKIVGINDALTECKKEIEDILENKFLSNYLKMKKEFKKKYPKYYQKEKYPSKDQLRAKFHFDWNFFQLDVPNKKSGLLPPSLYKKEKAKFDNLVAQMEEMTINMIGNLLFDRVKALESQCETGSINAGTVRSIDNFIQNWENLWEGHIDQVRFRNIVNSLRREMKKTTTESLKSSEQVREKLGNKLDKIMQKIQNVSAIDLKRRLVM